MLSSASSEAVRPSPNAAILIPLLKNPLLLTALAMTAVVALWGVLDTAGLAAFAQHEVA